MNKDFITVLEGTKGFFAVHIWRKEDEEGVDGPFCEFHKDSWGIYKTRESAEAEARQWAEETGIEYRG
jgi:hypothetical protein